ncbi:tRNA epoxyqueuosine(34) reductase QueG [Terracidiphilus gabretensis]|uniref:tRNA epoxyqueuosine(34) reductase QueG n=1 Tax=Terracidiphilus gabretensis TaxID=1577687 RepID=UPI00071BDFC7|nr:tRNA epoxyqueuosine(34) reductase QueG [Terracidiphilus gabretensis]
MEPTPQADPPRLSRDVARSLALKAGFTEAGVVSLPHEKEERDASRFQQWLKEGRAGTMSYLERTDDAGAPVRSRLRIPFPWAQSAILCSASYNGSQPLSTDHAPSDAGWIARYAQSGRTDPDGQRRPSDYHKILLKRLHALEAHLHQEYGAFESRAYVDTGPVVERSLAVAAGLGWQAKNTCLIHPKHGSFTFLAVLLTSLPVQRVEAPTAPPAAQAPAPIPDRCGSCRRCIEACPTNALIAPYKMDARLCISYLTIEHRGPIEPALMEQMGRQVFGCDICQDVCPWNLKLSHSPAPAPDPGLTPRPELVNPTLDWLSSLTEQEFEQSFNGSPVRRAGFLGLRRNIAIAMGNSGQRRFIAQLRAWLRAPVSETGAHETGAGLHAAAEWALKKLEDRSSENQSEIRSEEEK